MIRPIFAVLLALVALIRGYYTLRFGLLPQHLQKPREWYDWAAEIGAYSVAVDGVWFVMLGDTLPVRFGANETLQWVGLAAFGVGVVLFALSHFSLAYQWTWNIGLRLNHEMVQRGIYRHIRHPMYTAIGLWLLATPLILQSWLGLVPLLGLPGLYLRARVEERLMLRTFNTKYEAYRKTAGMFLPYVRTG